MKALAYRSNLIFITAPILVPICFLVSLQIFSHTRFFYGWLFELLLTVLTVMVSQLIGFVERLFMPKVLIEYDDCGLYIYKYRKSKPILLRYENIWDCRARVNSGSEDFPMSESFNPNKADSYERVSISSKAFVGMLNINTPHEVIRVHGIKDVKAVERKIASIRYEFKEKRDEWLDYNIELVRRERELEELAKHDINT